MKTLDKYARMLFVALACSLMLTSCYDDDDDYPGGDWRLAGDWEYVNYVDESAYCTFDFYENGTGYYSCYDQYGMWNQYPMNWWADGSYLSISVSWDTWNYTYSISRDYLYLYPQNGDPTLIFERD